MRNSILKKVVGTFCILILLSVLSLGVHIYLVKHKKTNESAMALARVDFNQALDPKQAQSIRDFAATLVGVQNAYCNAPQGTLVFMYLPAKQNAEDIYQKVKFYSQLPAKRYVPSQMAMNGGCTAGFGNNSASAKAISFLSKTIFSE